MVKVVTRSCKAHFPGGPINNHRIILLIKFVKVLPLAFHYCVGHHCHCQMFVTLHYFDLSHLIDISSPPQVGKFPEDFLNSSLDVSPFVILTTLTSNGVICLISNYILAG